MASATIKATIGGSTASLLVIYPHADNISNAELRAELLVIKEWFIAFNTDKHDVKDKKPSSTKSHPASVMLTTRDLHVSDTSPHERVHITGRVSTAAAWALDPKENNCCVHIYAKNNKLSDGYESWLLKSTQKSKLGSPSIVEKVAAALRNDRGTLGEGHLA
ncbi:hypothetical protein A0H81_06342 [Grifola frondosa]|uniref:Uncharacterized protein n=1 Tax=Grifola frondosa TaxID=5627 RepID=A0A1C7MEX3_GRIFR|nr:hypothetical protein A0H81_06342 [Grifola frondosa]